MWDTPPVNGERDVTFAALNLEFHIHYMYVGQEDYTPFKAKVLCN